MLIQVIIPAYNCVETLGRTLSSLQSQTDNDFDVIIVDDASSQDIMSVLERHDELNIKYIRHDKNKGCGMSRQTGIDIATADYIMFLDSDDILLPYTIAYLKSQIKKYPRIDMFTTQFYKELKDKSCVIQKNPATWCHGKLYKLSFLRKYNIRELPEIKYADDSYFNSICSELTKGVVMDVPTMIWCQNPNSVTNGTSFKENSLSDFIYAMIKSTEFISRYKSIDDIQHLQNTIPALKERYKNEKKKLSNSEKKKIEKYLYELSELTNHKYDR